MLMRLPQNSFSLFLVIWSGQLLSRLGSGISAFTLGVYLFQKTSSTSAYSFLLLCAFLPSVLLAPLGGVIADRKDRKLMMILGDIGSSLGILFTILMLQIIPDRDWPIYLGVAISSIFVALHSPAFKASVTDLVDEKAYSKASGLIQLAEASRYLLAPVIAAFLIARVSLPTVLVIDVLTFIGAAMTVVFIRKSAIQHIETVIKAGFSEDLKAGIRYIIGNKIVFHLLCLTTIVTFFAGILQSLFTPMVLSFADAATLGNVQSFGASGMLLSSLIIGCRSKTFDPKKVFGFSLFAAGIFYLLIGVNTNMALITLAFFCFLFTLPFVNTSLEILFRKNISNELQGRVWSLISLVSQVGMLIAFGIAGILTDHLFNPLLTDSGRLADNVGRLIGTGVARGSGFLIIISGCILLIFALYAKYEGRISIFKRRENKEKGTVFKNQTAKGSSLPLTF
jgi:MFS family permease